MGLFFSVWKGEIMSKDISSQYTTTRNREEGRRGYCLWKREKDTIISPKNYGIFIQRKNKGGNTK